jgi:hypothetical protein
VKWGFGRHPNRLQFNFSRADGVLAVLALPSARTGTTGAVKVANANDATNMSTRLFTTQPSTIKTPIECRRGSQSYIWMLSQSTGNAIRPGTS